MDRRSLLLDILYEGPSTSSEIATTLQCEIGQISSGLSYLYRTGAIDRRVFRQHKGKTDYLYGLPEHMGDH